MSSSGLKIFCARLYHAPNILRLISGTQFVWFMISEKGGITRHTFLRGACVALKVSTKHKKTPEFLIISVLQLTSYELVIFIDINTVYLQKVGISKHSWKKIRQLLWTCLHVYMFTKEMLNTELIRMLIVLVEFEYIRHSWILQQFQWILCNLSRWWIWQIV